jgi:hypothetical protein
VGGDSATSATIASAPPSSASAAPATDTPLDPGAGSLERRRLTLVKCAGRNQGGHHPEHLPVILLYLDSLSRRRDRVRVRDIRAARLV